MIDTKHENSVASMTPEFYLIGILQSLIDNKHEDMLRDYRLRIFTALKQLDHETLWWEMVRWGLEFLALNGRCPQSVEAIAQWFQTNESLGGNPGMRDNTRLTLEAQVTDWNDYADPEHKVVADLEVLLQRFLEAGRQRYHAAHHKVAAGLASGMI